MRLQRLESFQWTVPPEQHFLCDFVISRSLKRIFDLITIPRAKPNHFAENLEVMTFELSHEDMEAISSLNKNLRSNVLNDPETFPW